MSFEHCQRLLDRVTTWIDSLLALGWTSATAREIDEAGRLAHELADGGLELLADQLQKLTTLLPHDEGRQEAIAECLGRLFIALEMTRESAQLRELTTPS